MRILPTWGPGLPPFFCGPGKYKGPFKTPFFAPIISAPVVSNYPNISFEKKSPSKTSNLKYCFFSNKKLKLIFVIKFGLKSLLIISVWPIFLQGKFSSSFFYTTTKASVSPMQSIFFNFSHDNFNKTLFDVSSIKCLLVI